MTEKVKELVDLELKSANEKFPPFHSEHEGYAVILEEVEELECEIELIHRDLRVMWQYIKNGDIAGVLPHTVENVSKFAIYAACEAIQVAAMCKKFQQMKAQNGGAGDG